MRRPVITDPLGAALGWLWVLGTLAGFGGLTAVLSHDLDEDHTLAGSALSAPDTGPPAA